MPKKSGHARHIIGCMVHANSNKVEIEHIHESSMYFIGETWGDLKRPSNAMPKNIILMTFVERDGG